MNDFIAYVRSLINSGVISNKYKFAISLKKKIVIFNFLLLIYNNLSIMHFLE